MEEEGRGNEDDAFHDRSFVPGVLINYPEIRPKTGDIKRIIFFLFRSS